MGNHVAEVVEGLPAAQAIKVHARMCSELLKLVMRVSKIFPALESARPRCSSGIEALCLLNNAIVKSKSLLQQCSESSVLYLALTGEAILSRCKKSRNLLEQGLGQIQNMVPIMLAAKVSGIIADLRSANFCLDPSEEEAGKVLKELLHEYNSTIDSTEEAALAAIQNASSRLRISSKKALLIEKRSIKKLLDKLGERERGKRQILLFFLDLLKKYEKSLPTEQKVNDSSEHEHPFPFASPYHLSGEVELCVDYKPNEVQIGMLSRPVPPEEFVCPLSSRLMYDPVVIASGQTYERMWIQKWFDEGNKTCPKTNEKLANLSFASNTAMKDLIAKWCATYNVSIPDPEVQETLIKSWETSSTSIASMTSSLYDINLPLDFSNISLGSSQVSDPSSTEISNNVIPSRETDTESLSKFSELPLDSQCNVVEDVKRLLKLNRESSSIIPSEKFFQLILRFMRDARDIHDVEAQMTGCLLLFEFVQKHGILCIKEDTYDLLASFLGTKACEQALSVLEELSLHEHSGYKIISSGAVVGILNILDGQIQELLEPALKILSNLSSYGDVSSFAAPSSFIPKLTPLIEDSNLASYCITILKNMSNNENGRMSIAETDGCIASIVKLLEIGNHKDQEHAVSILLSLCSQRHQYCQLVMDEGIIPSLVSISVNGNDKAKAIAMELLRILKAEINTTEESSGADVSINLTKQCTSKYHPKSTGVFRKFFGTFAGKKNK